MSNDREISEIKHELQNLKQQFNLLNTKIEQMVLTLIRKHTHLMNGTAIILESKNPKEIDDLSNRLQEFTQKMEGISTSINNLTKKTVHQPSQVGIEENVSVNDNLVTQLKKVK